LPPPRLPSRRAVRVHKHAATRLHWDLRLEMDGVLKSWAVPKGPSAIPPTSASPCTSRITRFEYGDFEGIIPEGNYGRAR